MVIVRAAVVVSTVIGVVGAFLNIANIATTGATVRALGPQAPGVAPPPSGLEADAVARRLVSQMTLDEKIAMLHGDRDPENLGQAGYLPGVPRLGIPPLRLSDGPAGVRTGRPATALPAPVALAATFSPDLARRYGETIGRDGRAFRQDVMLAPMVNIVRVPQAGRNFETLGEDPLVASRLVAAEIEGIQSEGLMATVKHFAENNQESARQSVSADVDLRTMHEIELPGFEAAVKAHVASVMASYNKVNGTYASENADLETAILRNQWGFDGFVMSDWGATHSAAPALTAGLDLEMPGGTNYAKLAAGLRVGDVNEGAIDQAVRRILVQMARFGLLTPAAGRSASPVRTMGTIPAVSPTALEIATAGAVLLKNDKSLLPLRPDDFRSLAVIGPTGRTMIVGGGGSARVPPMHAGSVLDELKVAGGGNSSISYDVGYDLDGELIPASALALTGGTTTNGQLDFTGSRALPAGSTTTWSGTVSATEAGDYEIRLQTSGGRGSIQFDAPAGSPPAAGRGGRGGGGGAAGLLPTAIGLTNPVTIVHFDAGQKRSVTVTAAAGAQSAMEIRLAWIPPGWRDHKIAGAADRARHARTAVVFAYDEGSEGRDRASLSLPGAQDALIEAVASVNPRTVVVLNNGAPVLMPWADHVGAILEMWYPGQEGARATADLLSGAATPSGKLPVTFPRRPEDAPTADPARYPGIDGHGAYSEGTLVGYRWYDTKAIAPLFPFGHGLSYTTFGYSALSVTPAAAGGLGHDVRVTVRNTGTRAGTEVVQVYIGPPAAPPVPIAAQSLAAFARVTLARGEAQTLTLHIDPRAWSYWSVSTNSWVIAPGRRSVFVGSSSRDIRLTAQTLVADRVLLR
jgi:beta-glucosidase